MRFTRRNLLVGTASLISGGIAGYGLGVNRWREDIDHKLEINSTAPAWVPNSAFLFADFVTNRYFKDTVVGRDHILSDLPRTYQSEFSGRNWGIRTDEEITNIGNVEFDRAVVGRLGIDGALPPGVFVDDLGVEVDVTSKDSNSITLRFSSNETTDGGAYRLYLGPPNGISLEPNARYNHSLFLRQVGGSGVGIHYTAIGFEEFDGAGSRLISNPSAFKTIVSERELFPASVTTVSHPEAAFGRTVLSQILPSGTSIDRTIQISKAQLTKTEQRMPFTRSHTPPDILDVPAFDIAPDWAFGIDFRAAEQSGTGSVIYIGDEENSIDVRLEDYVLKISTVLDKESTEATVVGRVLPWSRSTLLLRVQSGGLQVSLNGKPARDCGSSPENMQGISLGRGPTGYLNGAIERIAGYRIGGLDWNLANLSRLSSLYDDFDRPDGTVGQPWSSPQPQYAESGTGVATLLSNRIVTTSSGDETTSRYWSTKMGANVYLMAGACAWSSDGSQSSAGLISTPNRTENAVTGITARSNHFLFSHQGIFAGVYSNEILSVEEHTYSTPMAQDSTVYSTVWILRDDGAIIVRDYTGGVLLFDKFNYGDHGGAIATMETYWSTPNPSRPLWSAWAAEAN